MAFRRYDPRAFFAPRGCSLNPGALWPFYHAEGIARDVRNATTADWSEDHMFGCLAWLYDGFALPSEGEEMQQRAQAGSRH